MDHIDNNLQASEHDEAVLPTESEEATSLYDNLFGQADEFLKDIKAENNLFPEALSLLHSGKVTVELKKKYILKAIDEVWVNAIEEALPSLDHCIRNPSRHIEEREEVMPIELSRNITDRSFRHLAQNTNYIKKIEGDKITPSKILNIFREETINTYENRFVNTLINRLFIFVDKRRRVAMDKGQDEKSAFLSFSGEFLHDNVKAKVNFGVEISEKPDIGEENPFVFTTPIWRRVERLFQISAAYTDSDFSKSMGRSYINPPVMRTNAIMKNKYLRDCLALWEFMVSYDDAGYGLLIQENAESVDNVYLNEVSSFLTLQYLLFRHRIKNEFVSENLLNSDITEVPITPKFITDIQKIDETEFDLFDTKYINVTEVDRRNTRRRLSEGEKQIMAAIDVILAVLPRWDERFLEQEARRKAEEEAARIAEEIAAREREEKEAQRLAAERKRARARRRVNRAKAEKEARRKRKQKAALKAARAQAKRDAEREAAVKAAKEEAERKATEEAVKVETLVTQVDPEEVKSPEQDKSPEDIKPRVSEPDTGEDETLWSRLFSRRGRRQRDDTDDND